MRPGALPDTAAMHREIAEMSRFPPGPGFDPAMYLAVQCALGDEPQAEAGRATPASRVTEAMLALLHAYFIYSREPSTAAHNRILDAILDLDRRRLLADVAGSA